MKISLKHKKIVKDYVFAVAASAITIGVALASEMEPHYAVVIGSIAGPLLKWADKNSKDYGIGSKK